MRVAANVGIAGRELPLWGLVVFSVALLVRVAFVVVQLQLQVFDIQFEAADTVLYRSLAESLLSEGAYVVDGQPTAFVTPGYPLFLAGLYLVSSSTLFIALVQSVLGAVTAVLVGAVAGRLEGPWAALAAGLVAALYPHLVFWTGYVLTETLYVFLIVFAIYLVCRVVTQQEARWTVALAAGLAGGAAALTRPVILGAVLLLGLVALCFSRWRVAGLAGLAGVVVILAPWAVRNAITPGTPVVTSTEAGYVLWQGNSPGATGGSRGYVDQADFEPLDLPEGLSEVERDRIYRARAIGWMQDNPERVAALAPKKLWNMWRPTYERASLVNRAMTYASYLPLMVLSVAGLALAVRLPGVRGLVGWILLGFVIYHLLVHATITGMIRFRIPVEAVLTIPAGFALARFYGRLRAAA